MNFDDIINEFRTFSTITGSGPGYFYARDDTFFYLVNDHDQTIKVGYRMTFDRWVNSVDYLLAFPESEKLMKAIKFFLKSKQINQSIVVEL